jgi:arginyl-tRNA synthetase
MLANWGGAEADLASADLSPLTAPHEASLLAKLAAYPEMLAARPAELGPHQVAFYLRELAGELHSFYFAAQVAGRRRRRSSWRAWPWMVATRQVLRNGLALIGVSAPDKM